MPSRLCLGELDTVEVDITGELVTEEPGQPGHHAGQLGQPTADAPQLGQPTAAGGQPTDNPWRGYVPAGGKQGGKGQNDQPGQPLESLLFLPPAQAGRSEPRAWGQQGLAGARQGVGQPIWHSDITDGVVGFKILVGDIPAWSMDGNVAWDIGSVSGGQHGQHGQQALAST